MQEHGRKCFAHFRNSCLIISTLHFFLVAKLMSRKILNHVLVIFIIQACNFETEDFRL